jgi:hypothetical protein
LLGSLRSNKKSTAKYIQLSLLAYKKISQIALHSGPFSGTVPLTIASTKSIRQLNFQELFFGALKFHRTATWKSVLNLGPGQKFCSAESEKTVDLI